MYLCEIVWGQRRQQTKNCEVNNDICAVEDFFCEDISTGNFVGGFANYAELLCYEELCA